MENPTNNNQPADQEEVKQENTQAAAAEGEERKLGDGEEEKKGEGKLLAAYMTVNALYARFARSFRVIDAL